MRHIEEGVEAGFGVLYTAGAVVSWVLIFREALPGLRAILGIG